MASLEVNNLNCGLSNHEGILTFYESSLEPALSTFSRTQANADLQAGFEIVERQCPVTTLANVCEQYVHGEIDFMSIDVEGHEREVIEGGDWKRWPSPRYRDRGNQTLHKYSRITYGPRIGSSCPL